MNQPPLEDARNGLQIAQNWQAFTDGDVREAFAGIERLLTHMIAQLGEPNEAAIRAARVTMRAAETWGEFPPEDGVEERVARDCAAAVISAQLRGSGSRGEPT